MANNKCIVVIVCAKNNQLFFQLADTVLTPS